MRLLDLLEQRGLAAVVDDSSVDDGAELGQMMLREAAVGQDMFDLPSAYRHLVRDDSSVASPP